MSLYQPPHFKSNDPAIAADIMRAHSFATLVSNDAQGQPFVSHLPLHLQDDGGCFTLWGHCAKPNPHWRLLQQQPRALVIFMGPHAYQSPRIYADVQRVPSWNYLAVHCQVEARLVEDAEGKDTLLKRLIGDHEPAYVEQWNGLPAEYTQKMLMGIVGFELRVTEWTCKLKINQHRPESHASLRAAYEAGGDDERELGRWMDRLGLRGE